ncbi:hypothetical protein [Sediminicola luteus]|nr:hypothetical protein [Sediminicola luteus]
MRPYRKPRKYLWIMVILAVLLCGAALLSHTKNWIQIERDQFKVTSGFYRNSIAFTELDSVVLVDSLPRKQRKHGFTVRGREKGVYQNLEDSTTVYVFLDRAEGPKVKLVYQDSLRLFVNYRDSLDTQALFETIQLRLPQSVN